MILDPNPFSDHSKGPWEAQNRADVEVKIQRALDDLQLGRITKHIFCHDRDERGAKRWVWGQHHPNDERWKLLGRPYWSVEAYASWRCKYLQTRDDQRLNRRDDLPHTRTFPKRSSDGDRGLVHEHVVPQKQILIWLLERSDPVSTILDHNIGAVVTVAEDRRLRPRSSHPNRRDPWLRYAGRGIQFVENPVWMENERDDLARHGLLVVQPSSAAPCVAGTRGDALRDWEFNGASYSLSNEEWRADVIETDTLDSAATRFGLDRSGLDVVRQLVDYVRRAGPVRGMTVVREAFGNAGQGAARMNWTLFFKYACNNCGMLRYKKKPAARSSPVIFAFPEHVSKP